MVLFFTPSADTQFQGEPVSGVSKYTWVGKFCDVRVADTLASLHTIIRFFRHYFRILPQNPALH